MIIPAVASWCYNSYAHVFATTVCMCVKSENPTYILCKHKLCFDLFLLSRFLFEFAGDWIFSLLKKKISTIFDEFFFI